MILINGDSVHDILVLEGVEEPHPNLIEKVVPRVSLEMNTALLGPYWLYSRLGI
jgi:hypothetical protein